MTRGRPPKSTGVKLTHAEMTTRNDKIYMMFVAGASEYAIARSVGVTRLRVNQILKAALERSARHHRLLEDQALGVYISRLEVLLRSCWPAAMTGDLKAIDTARKVLHTQARLFGLDGRRDPAPPLGEEEFDDDDEFVDQLQAYRSQHRRQRGHDSDAS